MESRASRIADPLSSSKHGPQTLTIPLSSVHSLSGITPLGDSQSCEMAQNRRQGSQDMKKQHYRDSWRPGVPSSATGLSILVGLALATFARSAAGDCPDPERPPVTTSQSLGVPSVSLNYYAIGSQLCFKQQHVVYECTANGWKKTSFTCSSDAGQSDEQSPSESQGAASGGAQSSGSANSSAVRSGHGSSVTTNQTDQNGGVTESPDTATSAAEPSGSKSPNPSSGAEGSEPPMSQLGQPASSAPTSPMPSTECNSVITPIVQECMKPYYGGACDGAKLSESCFQRALARGSGVCPDSLISQFRQEEQQAEAIARSACVN